MPVIEIDLPAEYRHCQDALQVRHEEDALCWFWAYPELFPWSRAVVWLYTPVVGNTRWPGDLWGIDLEGNLLIVECKQCRRSSDPFIDFLRYHRAGRDELSAASWLAKFPKHSDAELDARFRDASAERPPGKTDGCLPRSNKRQHIRRWPQLVRIIDGYIRSPQYRDTALRCLWLRAERGDPTPYYIALMVVSDPSAPVLSAKALASGRALQQKIGEDFVRAVKVTATPLGEDSLSVKAEAVEFA